MTIRTAVFVLTWSLGLGSGAASADVPLKWTSARIQSDDHGGAEIEAAIDDNGDLDRLDLAIKGRRILIPPHCLRGLIRPYLNGIGIAYGQFGSGQSYWSVEIPFDGNGSVELGSTFNLVLSDTELVWSYQSIQIDDGTWEDRDVCPYTSTDSSQAD